MKVCTKCAVEQALGNFSKQAKGRFGVTSICKACSSERGKAWHRANTGRSLASKTRYRQANPERTRAASTAWRIENAERAKATAALWTARNMDRKAASTARRRASILQAIPAWASLADIRKYYTLAGNVTRQTGLTAQVDHIVPLQSPLVCGLHCPANLMICTEFRNKSKGNRSWPDMPDGPRIESMWLRGQRLIDYMRATA